jgi:hypothetical protein
VFSLALVGACSRLMVGADYQALPIFIIRNVVVGFGCLFVRFTAEINEPSKISIFYEKNHTLN